jgi:hypothetical protein
MTAAMASLTWWASFWDAVSVWLAVLVFVGVAAEMVNVFDVFAKWGPLADPERRKAFSKGGLSLLVAALALEVIAAIGSHNANESIIGILNHELGVTIGQATNLERLTTKLGLSNAALQKQVGVQSDLLGKTGGALSILSSQSTDFQKTIRTQEARNNTDLASLKSEAAKFTEARNEILADAWKSADAAAAATKAQDDMTIALNAVQAMRQRMQEIITPRQIDADHFNTMIEAFKKFPKTSVDLSLTRDPEAGDLLVRVSDAFISAGWDIKPCEGMGFGLRSSARPNLPVICEKTRRGMEVAVSLEDQKTLGPAGDALINVLRSAGIPVEPMVVADKLPDGKPNPDAVKHGVIHICFGTKN